MMATHLETWEGDHYSASIYSLPNSDQKTIWIKIGIAAVEVEVSKLRELIELMEYIEQRIEEIDNHAE